MSRYVLAVGLLAAGLVYAPAAVGQDKKLSIHDKLAMEIETKDFNEELPLKTFIVRLNEQFATKGVDLAIVIDINSFREMDVADPGPYDDPIALPRIPKTVTGALALRLAVSQIRSQPVAIVVRNGVIEITTQKGASAPVLLRQKVWARFDKTPLADTMRQLTAISGVSILLDPRLHEKAQTPISADFRGDVPLEAALRMVADMAELRIVLQIDGGVYVTTPTNAEAVEIQLRERRKEIERQNELMPTPSANGAHLRQRGQTVQRAE